MQYILCLIVFLAGVGKSFGQSEVYNAVNQILELTENAAQTENPSFSYNVVLERSDGINFPISNIDELFKDEAIAKYFTEDDKQAFKNQIKEYKIFNYQTDSIRGKTILTATDLRDLKSDHKRFWDKYKRKFGNTGFYDISFPLFSKDRTKLLISIGRNSFKGVSDGGVYIYNKTNEGWRPYKALFIWMG